MEHVTRMSHSIVKCQPEIKNVHMGLIHFSAFCNNCPTESLLNILVLILRNPLALNNSKLGIYVGSGCVIGECRVVSFECGVRWSPERHQ